LNDRKNTWKFIDKNGSFELHSPDKTSHLYFPLINDALMMSSISPRLHGDVKIDQNHFLMAPVTVFDLHNTRSGRNFFVKMPDNLWSANGGTSIAQQEQDETTLKAGMLWHQITRKNKLIGLELEICNFVPQGPSQVELMRVKIKNISDRDISFTPIAAIPMFGRSADNIRDHRHVTSLLNRVKIEENGICLKPILSFDEKGHKLNIIEYRITANDNEGNPPVKFYPDVDSFVGEGGSLDWPLGINSQRNALKFGDPVPDGNEALGGLEFSEQKLSPGSFCQFNIVLSINQITENQDFLNKVSGPTSFETLLQQTKDYWAKKLDVVRIEMGNKRYEGWVRWVSLQPILRRLMGNSFLPYHDYGRGGRGWRDLWQDALGLLLLDSKDIGEDLFSYFAGVRLDGSNATIIGSAPGEFKADRNDIQRVWMDHGVWPLKTLEVYLDQTGDYSFLLKDQSYFKDQHTHRSKKIDRKWKNNSGNKQITSNASTYYGSIFEHLLVQHLTAFFNVGDKNNILLEGGDWNDGLDMASDLGESATFTAFYAGNLQLLSEYSAILIEQGIKEIDISSALKLLFDTCFDLVDYSSPTAKRERLGQYFELVSHEINPTKLSIDLKNIQLDLQEKSKWLIEHLQKNEWIETKRGSWFNGYYDNLGTRVEGDFSDGVKMTLTGQVFPIMAGVASDDQIREIIKAADKLLYDKKVGGYRLNTKFEEPQMELGRAFGFAYGTKENGSMFSHMAVMYAYALYSRGFAEAGYRVLQEIFEHCQDFELSRIYPGIPEYIDSSGRGNYPFLTGSASWYMFTLITQVFGIRASKGNLVIDPKLLKIQFNSENKAIINSHFSSFEFSFVFYNPNNLEAGKYRIASITLNGSTLQYQTQENGGLIRREIFEGLAPNKRHKIEVWLE